MKKPCGSITEVSPPLGAGDPISRENAKRRELFRFLPRGIAAKLSLFLAAILLILWVSGYLSSDYRFIQSAPSSGFPVARELRGDLGGGALRIYYADYTFTVPAVSAWHSAARVEDPGGISLLGLWDNIVDLGYFRRVGIVYDHTAFVNSAGKRLYESQYINISLLYFIVLAMLLPVWKWYRALGPARRDMANRCPHCDYDVRASPQRCPECGRARPNFNSSALVDRTPKA